MASQNAAAGAETPPELEIVREFAAPPEQVWRAWTEPERMRQWIGPQGFDAPSGEADVRPGGSYRYCIRSAEHGELWFSGTYRELDPPRALAFTFVWDPPPDRAPHEKLVRIKLNPTAAGGTRMTFWQGPFETTEDRDGHIGGWTETFDKLGNYLQQGEK